LSAIVTGGKIALVAPVPPEQPAEDERDRRFWAAIEAGSQFFEGRGAIHEALDRLTTTLAAQEIP
jgi:hypothetical protein